MNGKIALRTELSSDYRATENTVREAFWNVYAPGAAEHYLLHCLRKSPDYMPRLATVAVCGDTVVGAIACAAGSIRTDAGHTLGVVTVGPLGVLPDWQRRGIGGMLLDRTAALAAMQGHSALVLCGDPAYYSHRGFASAETYGIRTADDMFFDALQLRELSPGALKGCAGNYHESPDYAINEADVAAFDAAFPPKAQVEDTPTQLRFRQMLTTMRPR